MKYLLIIALPLFAACTSAPAQRLERGAGGTRELIFDGQLQPGELIEVKGVNGSIRAVHTGGSQVRLFATRTGRRDDPSTVDLVTVRNDRGYTVCAVPPSSRSRPNVCAPGDEGRLSSNNNDVKVVFDVEIPRGVDLAGWMSNGGIEATGLTGRVTAHSSNGGIEIDGGTQVIAKTSNGSVEIRSAGDAEATTTNGRITADLSRITNSGEPLRFTSTNGSVTVRLPNATNANLEASTTNGRIRTDFPVSVREVRKNRLEGQIGSGGRDIRIRTTNGNIHIEEAS